MCVSEEGGGIRQTMLYNVLPYASYPISHHLLRKVAY